MARVARVRSVTCGVGGDERGVVYVEFLLAFFPLFLLFLGICQLALLASAHVVVRHAALSGARSAIVVLEDDPAAFDGASRGDLREGAPVRSDEAPAVLAALGVRGVFSGGSESRGRAFFPKQPGQRGARMAPIRTAAYLPLLALAPDHRSLGTGENLEASLATGVARDVSFALEYTRAATVVTVHASRESDEPAAIIEPSSAVTLRVVYALHCAVPLAGPLLCQSAQDIAGSDAGVFARLRGRSRVGDRLRHAETPGGFARMTGERGYFKLLSAEVTLPNQAAGYYEREDRS